MHKLSHLVDGRWIERSYPPVFFIETVGGVERMTVGIPSGSSEPFEHLVLSMEPPYLLLYVLHTPRGEGEPGRYQSPALSVQEFQSFMARFGKFLSCDARFDIWAYSPAERATVVWDRHNQMFAYGPIDRFGSKLRALGFESGTVEGSTPHQHHYRQEFDRDASELLSWVAWSHSPLRPEDEQ